MHSQRGMSFLGLLATVAIVGFLVVLGLKLVPVYIESWKIDKTLADVVKDPGIGSQPKENIVQDVLKRLDLDDVKAVNYSNWKESMTVTKRQNRVIIEVSYKEQMPLIGNLYLLAEFDKRVEN
ncbi:MAG: DUF4845 domain-containing protein [Gammaproteobacteria bacterium]|nr:DUF4845 domain-containing protein [Gammaproteobacteria bacterium]